MITDYAEEFINYLKRNDLWTFTHKDILNKTTANCSYRVFQTVKSKLESKGFKIIPIWEFHTNQKNQTKRYKRYWIEAH